MVNTKSALRCGAARHPEKNGVVDALAEEAARKIPAGVTEDGAVYRSTCSIIIAPVLTIILLSQIHL